MELGETRGIRKHAARKTLRISWMVPESCVASDGTIVSTGLGTTLFDFDFQRDIESGNRMRERADTDPLHAGECDVMHGLQRDPAAGF